MQMMGGELCMLGTVKWSLSKSCTVPAPLDMALSSTAGSQAYDLIQSMVLSLLSCPLFAVQAPPSPIW